MSRKSQRWVYVVVLVVGVALVAWGFNDYGAFGNKLSRALGGKLSDRVLLEWIAGGALSLFGLFGLLRGK